MIHMIMGQQKLLEAARRPVVHQMREPRVQQCHRIIELDHPAHGVDGIVPVSVLVGRPRSRSQMSALAVRRPFPSA